MTVANTTRRISAVGNAAIGQEVPFSFPYAATSDITVYSRVTATGVETLLAETTNYTLTAASDTGGTLTTVIAVAATSEIHIIRDTPKTQSLDLEQGGSFSAENIEDALDKNTKLIIENKDSYDRALRAPATDAVALDLELPNSVDRASKNLGFDASGNVTVTESDGTFAVATAVWDDVIIKSPYVDIRSRGAVGDGVTDNAAAIQLALDSLSSTGGAIYIPTGHFKYGTTLDVPTGVHMTIRGEGTKSILDYTGGGANNGIDVIGVTGSRAWITFKDFLLQGTAAMTNGIQVEWGTFKSSMQNVYVQIFGGAGFYIKGSHGMVLNKCTADTGIGNGFYVESGITSLIGCIGQSVTGRGIYALSTPIQVVGGFYESNTVQEIYLDQCTGFLLSGVFTETIYDAVPSIYATGTNHCYGGSIVGCTLTRSPVTGGTAVCINLNKAHGVLVAGNYLHPHADAAGLTGVPHIIVNSFCSDIQIGHNAYKGLAFTNPCEKVAVTDGATGISIMNNVSTFTDSDATPSLSEGNIFLTNTTGVTITRFDDVVAGEEYTITSKGAIVFDTSSASRLIGSSVDITTAAGDVTFWICETGGTTTSVCRLKGFVDVSANNSGGA